MMGVTQVQGWYDAAQAVVMEHAGSILFALLGAILLWLIGSRVIRFCQGLLRRNLERKKVDPTLVRYADSTLGVGLNILLFISVLSTLGVQTSTFAAVVAAAGVAIGLAWSGLLAHLAAGIFLIVLRPFKVGDMVQGAGIVGEVKEIGLFVTTIDTGDNTRVFVGNNKLFSDNIVNYSTNPFRRVDLKCQLDASVNVAEAIAALQVAVANVPNIARKPLPMVEVLEFTQYGPVIAVRPFCSNMDYWQVYFDTNRAIVNVVSQQGYAVPANRTIVSNA